MLFDLGASVLPPIAEPEPPPVPEPLPVLEPEPSPEPEPTPEPRPDPRPEPAARRLSRVPWVVAAAVLVVGAIAGFLLMNAGGEGSERRGGGEGPATSAAGTLTLEDAALDGTYAMEMTLIRYENGPQMQFLWGADQTQREIGRVWPAEDWLFSSTCFPDSCDSEVTVQGRGKKTWLLTKDGRSYADVTEGLDCDGTVVTRALNITVSDADTIDDVYRATNVEGRLTIQVQCPGYSAPERATFSLSGTLNA